MGVFNPAPLQTGESVVKLHGQFADAVVYGLVADHDMLVAVCKLSDGGDDCRGTGAECFGQLAVFARCDKLINGNLYSGIVPSSS